MTEQQTAPAKANLEYRAIPLSFSGVLAATFWTRPSSLVEPVDVGAGAEAIVLYMYGREEEEEEEDVCEM